VLGLTALGGVFASAATAKFYAGVLANMANGMPSPWLIDGKLANFGCAFVILLAKRA
jgi:hypothetical protein